MHEMMLVENIVDIVLKQAKMADASNVKSVKLKIGEIRDVIDPLMEKCFRFVARGTIAENAELQIERIPVVVQCQECGKQKAVAMQTADVLCCEQCGSQKLNLISGREFLIEEIEIC